MRRIRTRDGGQSPYGIERAIAVTSARYHIRNEKTGDSWIVYGPDPSPGNGDCAKPLPKYVLAEVHREWCRDLLRVMLPPGATVYTIRRSPMGSGMAHLIDLVAIVDNEPEHITGLVATAAGYPMKRDCLYVDGGGMDLGFAVVDNLGYALYPDGYQCTGEDCPSSAHNNPPFPKREGTEWHRPGSVFTHRWL